MKRVAGSDLNHDNWDEEEEKEDRGQFLTADKNTIANRKVIVAKRKPTSGTSGVFRGMNAFSQMTNTSFSVDLNRKPGSETTTTTEIKIDSNEEKHMKALKVLNQQFLDCITKHVTDNPICVLTPTLDDYSKNLSLIKTKYPLAASDTLSTAQSKPADIFIQSIKSFEPKTSPFKFGFPSTTADKTDIIKFGDTNSETKSFSFGVSKDKDESDKTKPLLSSSIENKSIFGNQSSFFGKTDFTTANSSSSSMFSFPSTGNSTATGSGFSFIPNPAPNGGGLFGSTPTVAQQPMNIEDDDNEEYVPPEPEVKDVKESDSVFDIKCKLFYQKDKEWKQRGIGNLFIKPMSEGKFQLVIRADNSLATIILNVIVNDKKLLSMNKNNVSLFACTDFIEKNKMTPLLIRVKTEDNAKQLLKTMEDQL